MRLSAKAAADIVREFHLSRTVAFIFVLLVIVLVASSCSPTEPTVPPAEPAVSPAEPTVSPVEADLTAREVAVQLERQSEQVPVGVDEHVPVEVGDQVRVNETGRALLRFRDDLLVELFHQSGAVVSDARLEPGGFIFVRLKQTFGFTRNRVESLADARLTVETDYATIRALDSGTEFLLGHGEPLTCIVPLEGAAEVEAQGQTMVVRAGEATYILPDKPPEPLVCANLEEARAWADRKRGPEEVEPLGAVVKRWEQEPCPSRAELPTYTPSPAEPAISPVEAELTAKDVAVQLERQSEQVPVGVDEHVPVEVGDQVWVDETGRALLRFRDALLVELFHQSGAVVREAHLERGESIFVRLKQTFGFSRTDVESRADARVILETDYATIRALDSGTEFLLGHGEPLTCIVPLEGAAEVEAQGQTMVVRAGEATYVLPGEPPRPLVCANLEEARAWADRKRGTEEVEPLGAVVKRWEQEPCPAAAQALPTASPTAALPPSEGMVRIEGGLYGIGIPQADDLHVASQQIELAVFWIDQYEVTNAQYKAFLDETGRQAAPEWPGGTFPAGQENHPVKGVSWDEAAAYCAWANKRLPTEAQWEAAARGPGPEPPLYPWGDDPRANGQVDQLPLADTYPVGAMPFNQSPFGVYDVAGNVWEWVGEPYAPVADGHKVLRGGRHGLLRDMAYRQQAEPNDERFRRVAGFRCAADEVSGGY